MKFCFFEMLFSFLVLYSSVFAEEVVLKFDLKQYFAEVVKKNQSSKVNQYDIEVSRATYHEFRDLYSPFLTSRASANVLNSPNPNTNYNFGLGIEKTFPILGLHLGLEYSGEYGVPFDIGFFSSLTSPTGGGGAATGNTGRSLESVWTSKFKLNVRQSILRQGPIGVPNFIEFEILKKTVRLQRNVYNSKLSGVLRQANALFWQLKLANRNLVLLQAALKDTKWLLGVTKRKVSFGTADISESFNLEAILQDNEEEIALAKKDIKNISREIAVYVGEDLFEGDDYEVVITEDFSAENAGEKKTLETNEAVVLKNFVSKRDDVVGARLNYDIAKNRLYIAKLNVMPELNLNFTVDYAGRNKDFGISVGDTFGNFADPNFYLGLNFQMPLNPAAFYSIYEKADKQEKKAKENFKQIKEEALLEIDKAFRDMEYVDSKVKRSFSSVKKMRQRLSSYRRDFEIGKINAQQFKAAYDLLRSYERRYLASLYEYEILKINFIFAKGDFFETYELPKKLLEAKVK